MTSKVNGQIKAVKELVDNAKWFGMGHYSSVLPYGKNEIVCKFSFFNPEGNLYCKTKYVVPYGIITKRDRFLGALSGKI